MRRVEPAIAKIASRIGAACLLSAALAAGGPLAAQEHSRVCYIISGLGGLSEYEENFETWSQGLEELFAGMGAKVHRIDGRTQRRTDILKAFSQAKQSPADSEVWVFLVGHGTISRDSYRFNIKGPDLTEADLREFVEGLGSRRVFLVAGTSSSGELLSQLPGENRVVLTATRSRRERFPPLFLSFFLQSASEIQADTNKDGKVSLLEAYVFSRNKVAQWFQDEGRLQTEHAVLDDNGARRIGEDKAEEISAEMLSTGTGMLASIAYISQPPAEAYASEEARRLSAERREVELRVESLKFRKSELTDEQYFSELEALLVELAELSARISELEGKSEDSNESGKPSGDGDQGRPPPRAGPE